MRKRSYIKFSITLVTLVFAGLMLLTGSPEAVAQSQGNPFAEWSRSKHANLELAQEEATVESRGVTAAHCGRCHSEQGFVAWVPQLLNGDPGNIKKPDGSPADIDYLTSLGLTHDSVRPITCLACHGDGFALRVLDSAPMLPAGFDAVAVGAGALCMSCHNTRNGRITWNATDTGTLAYRGPHEAAQADVVMGKNAYFVNDTLDLASPHALYTGDSCVTCHVHMGKEGHTFEAATTVCAQCHGPALSIEFVQRPIEQLENQLKAAIERKVLAVRGQIGFVRSWNPATDVYTDMTLDGNQITGIAEILTIHGQSSFRLGLGNGTEVYTRVADILQAAGGNRVFATTDPVVRACWNYLLFEYDGSKGVHNPGFARDVLMATISALR